MEKQSTVILCQPGNGKGCCVCCGLFNYMNISYKELSLYLSNVYKKNGIHNGDSSMEVSLSEKTGIRDNQTYICPYMGFIFDGIPGCTVHPSCNECDERDYSVFGKTLCNDYFCPAHRILDDRYKNILIHYTCNWYTYSIGIIDPESFIWIVKCIEGAIGKPIAPLQHDVNEKIAIMLNESLMQLADLLNEVKKAIFYYSEPEYYLNMRAISLPYETSINASTRRAIKKYIETAVSGCCS